LAIGLRLRAKTPARIKSQELRAKAKSEAIYRQPTSDRAAIVGDTMSGLQQTLAFRPAGNFVLL
jgi:hypothetical protein